jgi:FkbM family methyltransferase
MEKVDFFQVGANVGYTETDMLFGQELVNKNIILIEPVPYIFKVLHENYLIKNSNNGNTNKIICFNFGISNKNDSLELYIPSEKNDFDMYPSFIHQLCSIHKDHIYKHTSENYPDLIIDKINVVKELQLQDKNTEAMLLLGNIYIVNKVVSTVVGIVE